MHLKTVKVNLVMEYRNERMCPLSEASLCHIMTEGFYLSYCFSMKMQNNSRQVDTVSVHCIPQWVSNTKSMRTRQPHSEHLTLVSFYLVAHFHTFHMSSLPTLSTLDLGPISDHYSRFIRTRKPIIYPFTYQFQLITSHFLAYMLKHFISMRKQCRDDKDVSYRLGVGYRLKICMPYIHDGHLPLSFTVTQIIHYNKGCSESLLLNKSTVCRCKHEYYKNVSIIYGY